MKILLLLYLVFGSVKEPLHQDTLIKLKNNGALVGLPDKYFPASFDKKSLILEIAKNRIKIPDCVTKYFTYEKNLKFHFTASWYHNRPNPPNYEPLPNYMSLIVSSPKIKADIQILFNLETLEIFKIYELEKNVSVNGVNYLLYFNKQEISQSCKQEIFTSITQK